MWFRKKTEYVECAGCGCLMRRARKEVEVEWTGSAGDTGSTMTIYLEPQSSVEFYCGRCAPAYDLEYREGSVRHYYRKEPPKNIEVTEKGKDIGVKGD